MALRYVSTSFHFSAHLPLILTVVLLLILATYAAIAAVIAGGIHARYPRRKDFPSISIVIPARNEERNLPALLDSLLALDYPAESMEIILVNDQSDDHTREIAESYRYRFKCKYEIYDVETEHDQRLRAKTRPLTQGLDKARGEFFLMPDADNRMPPEWAKTMVSYFADGVGMVCGPILPDRRRFTRLPLTFFETVDMSFLLGVCAGFSGLGKTQALIGSNFAIRRSAYEEMGTYRGLAFHMIEDLSLLGGIHASSSWKAVFPADAGTVLWTLAQPDFRSFLVQRYRWFAGRKHVKFGIRAALFFGFAAHAAWPLWLFFPVPWSLALYGLLAAGDGLVAGRMLKQYRQGRFLWLLPLYPIFVSVYGLGMLILLLTKREVVWKERSFIK